MTRGVYMHYLRFFSSSTRNWVTKKKVSKVGLKKKRVHNKALNLPEIARLGSVAVGEEGGGGENICLRKKDFFPKRREKKNQ